MRTDWSNECVGKNEGVEGKIQVADDAFLRSSQKQSRAAVQMTQSHAYLP
jgi:hypothetical protein